MTNWKEKRAKDAEAQKVYTPLPSDDELERELAMGYCDFRGTDDCPNSKGRTCNAACDTENFALWPHVNISCQYKGREKCPLEGPPAGEWSADTLHTWGPGPWGWCSEKCGEHLANKAKIEQRLQEVG